MTDNSTFTPEECFSRGPQSPLEKVLMEEYLAEKGYKFDDLRNLPADEAKRLMKEACMYAGLRLAEIEAKAGFRQKIHYESH